MASRSARVFDLTDALARRDRGRGLLILHELLDIGVRRLRLAQIAILKSTGEFTEVLADLPEGILLLREIADQVR